MGNGFGYGWGGGLAGGVAQGIQNGMAIGDYIKQQALENDLADASKTQLEEVPGADGAASTWKFGDVTYDKQPKPYQVDLDRSKLIANRFEAHGMPDRAIATRAAADHGFKLAQESAATKALQDAASNSNFASIQAKNDQATKDWEKAMADYKAGSDSGAAVGQPPAKPVLQRPNSVEILHDLTNQMGILNEHGQFHPESAMQLARNLREIKREGGIDVMNAIHAGDVNAAIKAWRENGDMRDIDPNAVQLRKATATINGTQVPTHEAVIRNPDGSVQVINGAQGLQAMDHVDKTLNMVLNAHQDQRAAASEGRAATTFSQGQDERRAMIAARAAETNARFPSVSGDLLKAAGYGHDLQPFMLNRAEIADFVANNQTATPAQIAMVNAGSLPAALASRKMSVTRAMAQANGGDRMTPEKLDALTYQVDPNIGLPDQGVKSRYIPSQFGGGVIESTDKQGRITIVNVGADNKMGNPQSFNPQATQQGQAVPAPDTRKPSALSGILSALNPSSASQSPAQPGGQQKPSISPGQVDNGYQFRGGDPRDAQNWSKVQPGSGAPSAATVAGKGILRPDASAQAGANYEEGQVVNTKNGGKGVVEKVNGELKIRPLSPGQVGQPPVTNSGNAGQDATSAEPLTARLAKASSDPRKFTDLAFEAQDQLPKLQQQIVSAQRAIEVLPASSEAEKILQQTLERLQKDAQIYQAVIQQQNARTGTTSPGVVYSR